jgi:high frequency lysogenization protein
MSRYTDQDRALAFAGIVQGARLARDVARKGVCDAQAFEASRQSLFDFEPADVPAVFGGPQGVLVGMRTLLAQLDQPAQRDLEVSRYSVAMLHLADRLRRDKTGMQGLYEDLKALQRRRDSFQLEAPTLHGQIGEIYQSRISVLGPRIMIKGEPLHLRNPDNASRIRVALLAGIRAAVLWRQAGGSKWQLLIKRPALTRTLRELIDRFTD